MISTESTESLARPAMEVFAFIADVRNDPRWHTDVLEARLDAERAVLPGAGHSIPRAPGYNDVLADFVERAS